MSYHSPLRVIPVHEPVLGDDESDALRRCVEAGDAGGHSPTVAAFERAFAARVGVPEAVATSSGTTALHLALVALGIGPGDEVVVPAFTFAPCADMVALTGATAVLVDSDPTTFNVTVDTVRAALSPATKAVLAVHLFGHPCDVGALRALCDERGLQLVEDCAQGLGAMHRGRPVGSDADVACYSFYANKLITTGEGGMITTGDGELAERIRRLRSHAPVDDPERGYVHGELGFNYRMSAFPAAVGLTQLERMDSFLSNKAANATRYDGALSGCRGVRCPVVVAAGDRHAHWAYAVLIDEAAIAGTTTGLIDHLRARGVETRRFYHPLHLHPGATERSVTRGDLSACEGFAPRGLVLPSGNALTAEQVDTVVAGIADYVDIPVR